MTTERIQVLDYVTVDGVTLAPSGNPHTVSASTAALLIAARKALPYSKPPRLMPLYIAVITAADLPGFVGQPSVVYELDQPPYTWHRWNGSALVEITTGPITATPPTPSPPPPADATPEGALLLDGAALVLDGDHLVLSP